MTLKYHTGSRLGKQDEIILENIRGHFQLNIVIFTIDICLLIVVKRITEVSVVQEGCQGKHHNTVLENKEHMSFL